MNTNGVGPVCLVELGEVLALAVVYLHDDDKRYSLYKDPLSNTEGLSAKNHG